MDEAFYMINYRQIHSSGVLHSISLVYKISIYICYVKPKQKFVFKLISTYSGRSELKSSMV